MATPTTNGRDDVTPGLVVTLLAADQARDKGIVDELVRIINSAYAIGEAGLWRDGTTRTAPSEIADMIREGGVLVATLGGRLVGCARVLRLDADTADLGLISAAPEQWGSGIGRELVREAEDRMHRHAVGTMQLELLVPKGWQHPNKQRLHDWYTRLGYRVIRTVPFEQVVAGQLERQLATPCEFLIFHKALAPTTADVSS